MSKERELDTFTLAYLAQLPKSNSSTIRIEEARIAVRDIEAIRKDIWRRHARK